MLKVKVNDGHARGIEFDDSDYNSGKLDGKSFNWDVQIVKQASGFYHIIKDNNSYNTSILEFDSDTKTFQISVRGNVYTVRVKDDYDELLENLGFDKALVKKANDIKAPMPGLVKEIHVEVDQEVPAGQSLLILEAMKMENVIKAPADCVIKSIEISQGTAVEKNQVMIKFK
ncbi:acetyl-CoA carboxylase biotin carboxyl carrier protein subunit [Bacteroidota bacterium]